MSHNSSKFNYANIIPRVWAQPHQNYSDYCYSLTPSTFLDELSQRPAFAGDAMMSSKPPFSHQSMSSIKPNYNNLKNNNSNKPSSSLSSSSSSSLLNMSTISAGSVRRDREEITITNDKPSDLDHHQQEEEQEFNFWSDLCSPNFFDIPEVTTATTHHQQVPHTKTQSNFPCNLLITGFVSNPSFPCSNIPPLASAIVHSMRELNRRQSTTTTSPAPTTRKSILYIISPSPKSVIMEEIDQHIAANVAAAFQVHNKKHNNNNRTSSNNNNSSSSTIPTLFRKSTSLTQQQAIKFIADAVKNTIEIVSPTSSSTSTASSATWKIEHVWAAIDLIKHKILVEQEKLFRTLIEQNVASGRYENHNKSISARQQPPATSSSSSSCSSASLSFAVIIDQIDKYELSTVNNTNIPEAELYRFYREGKNSSGGGKPSSSVFAMMESAAANNQNQLGSLANRVNQHREKREDADIRHALRFDGVYTKLMRTSSYVIAEATARDHQSPESTMKYLYDFVKTLMTTSGHKNNITTTTSTTTSTAPSSDLMMKIVLDAVQGLKVLECSSVSCTGSCNYFYPVVANHHHHQNNEQEQQQGRFQQLAKQLVHTSVELFSDRIMFS